LGRCRRGAAVDINYITPEPSRPSELALRLMHFPCPRRIKRALRRRYHPGPHDIPLSIAHNTSHGEYWLTKCKRRQRTFQRRNSLSLGSTSRKYNQQAKSSFFQRFPYEIRRMIYAYVLPDETFVHLTIAGKRFIIPGCANDKCPTNPCQFHLEENEEEALLKHTGCVEKFTDDWRFQDPWLYNYR
jgi:hypothetical protein